MPHLGAPELLILLIIGVVFFGAGKLPQLGSSLGSGIKNFKKAMDSAEDDDDDDEEEIDVTPKKKKKKKAAAAALAAANTKEEEEDDEEEEAPKATAPVTPK